MSYFFVVTWNLMVIYNQLAILLLMLLKLPIYIYVEIFSKKYGSWFNFNSYDLV